MSRNKRFSSRNERGLASIETIPLLFIFVFLFAYTLGAFGIIHTGIMQSISARTYAFETFRNRSNVVYFRDAPGTPKNYFKNVGSRHHAVASEARQDNDTRFLASERPIRMGIEIQQGPGGSGNPVEVHNQRVHSAPELGKGRRNQTVEVSPAWIMVQYGMCLNVQCGDTN